MNILFIHETFPTQFKWIAPALAERGHHVIAMNGATEGIYTWKGIRVFPITLEPADIPSDDRWLRTYYRQVRCAEAVYKLSSDMKATRFDPDVIVVHPGWGHGLLLRETWPNAVIILYCEYFPQAPLPDAASDAGYSPSEEDRDRVGRLSRGNYLIHAEIADYGIAPTSWQADLWPEAFRSKISVMHEGIDTDAIAPNPDISIVVKGRVLSRDDEVITYAARNFEPARGAHTVIRALPKLLSERPEAVVLFIGGDGAGYGATPDDGTQWLHLLLSEVIDDLTPEQLNRIVFINDADHETFLSCLRVSRAHIYLTKDMFLSWSLLEAMSVGCSIVSSETPTVTEVLEHEVDALLVEFSSDEQLLRAINVLLSDVDKARALGVAARQKVVARFDVNRVTLPEQLAWFEALESKIPIKQSVAG